MPKSSIVHEPALCRDTLMIAEIICFASGEPDWPPTDVFWDGIQADLKHACDCGELTFTNAPDDKRRLLYRIHLHDLWGFLVKQDQRWNSLRDFCRRWAQARGITLSPEQAVRPETKCAPKEPADVPSRREQGKQRTEEKYRHWYELSQKIKEDGQKRRPLELARKIRRELTAESEEKKQTTVLSQTIKRRLNEFYPGWVD